MANTPCYWQGTSADNDITDSANYYGNTMPQANSSDSLFFPAATADADKDVDGADFSGTELVDLTFEDGCYLNFGSREAFLDVNADYVDYAGQGNAYLNIEGATEVLVRGGAGGTGAHTFGLALAASADSCDTLIVNPGSGNDVGIAPWPDVSGTWTTATVRSGNVEIGDTATITTLTVEGGSIVSLADGYDLTMHAGAFEVLRNNPADINLYGGTLYYSSSDVPTGTVKLYGGTLDFSRCGSASSWNAVTIEYYGGAISDPDGVVLSQGLDGLDIKTGGRFQIS